MNAITRLNNLQSENDIVRAEMLAQSDRFDRIRGTKPRPVVAFNLFQTPETIAREIVKLIPKHFPAPYQNLRILEPSAGLGRLYRAAFERFGRTADYHLVENNPQCAGELYRQDLLATLYQQDFLTFEDPDCFDVVVMNPPFKNGIDRTHILHALSMLRPGGILAGLCYNGPRQARDLKPLADHWEVLPEGTFKESGTMASVVLLTIAKA